MAGPDYDAIAAKYGGKDVAAPPSQEVDYDTIAKKFGGKDVPKKPGVIEDVVKSIPGAIPRAAGGLVGLPQTLADLNDTVVRKIVRSLGGDQRTEDIVTQVMGILTPQATALKKINDLGVPNLGGMVEHGYDEISKAAIGSPVYRPQTGPGRIVDTTTQVLVSGPGSIPQKLVTGAAAGFSGEGARLVTNNPIAIGVIQMLGGSVASLPFILRSVPAENINKAIQGISEKDLAKAQKLMDDAMAMGTPITGAEAIAQVTGRNTLQDIQRVVEGSREGGPRLQTMMNERPDANRAAFGQVADQIAPMPQAPSATPVRMQQAAEEAITAARKSGNERAKPFYDAARERTLSPAQASATVFEPSLDAAIRKVISDPMSSAYRKPANSVAAIDAAKKYLDDVAGAAALRGENELAKNARTGAAAAREVATSSSPEYGQALNIVAENRRNLVEPMKASPVGDIASTKGLPAEAAMKAQGEILMPTAPRALDPATIRETVRTLGTQDPNAARNFTRQNIEAIFNEATQNNAGGANQWGAAKFSAQIAGNPAQRDNLQALVEATGGKRAWAGFERMIEVMEAQGKRFQPGSNTARDLRTAENLAASGMGGAPAAASTTLGIGRIVYEWYQNFRFGKNTAQMAEILTDPKSVELMKELARYAPDTAKASALTAQLVIAGSAARADAARSPESRETQP